jgi:uracil-DNA glycosylase
MHSTIDKYFLKKPTTNGKRKPSKDESDNKEKQSKKKSDLSDTKTKLDDPYSTKEILTADEIKTKSESDHSFPSLEEFKESLGTWREPLKGFINTDKMKSIYNFISKEYSTKTILPPKDLIFNAFDKTTYDNVKVVIIGQDPYPTQGNAMGLSFSIPRGVKIPKSLQNIYKCLEKDEKVIFKTPNHGDLTKWATQGVFLLNATLTVEANNANSHQKKSGWVDFTDFVIKSISNQKSGIVFLLWGKYAIDKKKFIDNKKHFIIENIHPSPLAASKGDFTESKQFSEANEILAKEGKEPIDWSLDN